MERYLLCVNCIKKVDATIPVEVLRFLETHTHSEEERHILACVNKSFFKDVELPFFENPSIEIDASDFSSIQ